MRGPVAASRAKFTAWLTFGEAEQQCASELSRIRCERLIGQFVRSPERQHAPKGEGELSRQASERLVAPGLFLAHLRLRELLQVQDQIDDSGADAVLAGRASIPTGSREPNPFCAICRDDIPEGRRRAMPGVAHMASDHFKAFGLAARGFAA